MDKKKKEEKKRLINPNGFLSLTIFQLTTMGKQNLGFLRGNWMKKPCLILFEQRKGRGKKKSTRLFATSRLVGFFEDRKGNVCVPTRPPNMIFFCTHAARESRHTHSHTLHYTTLRIHSPSIKPCDPGREPVRPSRYQWNCRAAPSSFSLLVLFARVAFSTFQRSRAAACCT